MSKESVSKNGVSTLSLLGLLFIGLKLGHVIDWSWWWVTIPFWGGLAIFLGCLFIFLGILVCTAIFSN